MNNLFSLEGPIYKYGSMLADIVVISLLWLLFSLPIVTMGASTSAAYYVFTRRVVNREGYMFQDFWASFKRNFLCASLVWVTIVAAVLLLVFNLMNMGQFTGTMYYVVMPAQFVIGAEIVFVTVFIFPLIARFELTYRSAFKAAFVMANRHLPTTILVSLLLAGLAVLVWVYEIAFLICPGVYCFVTSYLFMNVFRKYRPEIAPDPDAERLAPIESLADAEERFNREEALAVMEEAARAQAKVIEATERHRAEREN